MNELKPCSTRAMWDAVTELEDMAMHPSIKKRLSAETLAISITAIQALAERNRRPDPENKPLAVEHLDCKTCQFEDRQADEEPCRHCKGAYPSRHARKPELEEK